ncbi:long-chain-fatty-acid--CoA ligase [Streptomyces sp. NPDC054766]|uniref:long-chain-fatty-acid--CoA ligase n=1 Tax=Streptomyces rhizosphaerihabitans TaxID=1266770 RepID=UPI0021BEE959|nr:long-chain fatty acid--CoA ligase [Streptomyces rhizosphaerihabitans]MCT9007465.1 long-chain fatty acid--CoA ligase [Streptomyces rhizosphaerihabitans]
MTNLVTLLAATVAAHGERVAVRHDDSTLTYAELDDASARVAALLRDRGVLPGDRVAMTMPNVPLFPVLYYGIMRAGGVVVPMNPLLKAREVAFTLRDCGARIALVFPLFADEVTKAAAETGTDCLVTEPEAFDALLRGHEPMRDTPARTDDDPALILYTSGTTGTPKGAELSHRNLASNTLTTSETLLQVGPDDVLFGGLPLFHAFGQTCGLNTAVAAGATLTLLPRFDPRSALEIIARDEVTVFLGVPTMYAALLHAELPEDFDTGRLRLAVSGGSALPVEVLHGFERRFGAAVLEGYGLSETSPVAAFNHPDRPRKPGSIGLPIRGVEMRLVAEGGGEVEPGGIGEIAIRGENIMTGYWNRPDATAEAIRDGWFHSGDLARVDEDGFYFIVDRKKDMIIRGGYNVYPREIEEVLYEHPAVAEAAVVGVPHPLHGEEVAAVVTLRPGAEATAEEIRAHTKERVAAYKYPRIVTIAAELPKGPTGKILKREIVVSGP